MQGWIASSVFSDSETNFFGLLPALLFSRPEKVALFPAAELTRWPLMSSIPAPPPQKPSRRAPSHTRVAVRMYAKTVGELLWSANAAQSSFHDLFSVLVDRAQLDAGSAIWFTIQTDKAQLQALLALVKVRFSLNSRIFQNINWAVSAAEKLAGIRNDAAHMAMSPGIGPRGAVLLPNPLGNPPTRLNRREDEDFLTTFGQAKGDYVQLQRYVHDVFCHLAYPTGSYPLPLRPRLQSVVVGPKRKR